jgi:hypothetical protein
MVANRPCCVLFWGLPGTAAVLCGVAMRLDGKGPHKEVLQWALKRF